MSTKLIASKKISNSQERLLVLIGLIVGLLLLVPILNRLMAVRMVLDLFLTAIALSMVYAVSSRKSHVIAGSILAMVMLSSIWLQYFHQNETIAALGMMAGVLFIGVVMANFLTFMLKVEEVTREVIYVSLLLYLMFALMCSFFYTFLALIDPTSFDIPHGHGRNGLLVFQYYSFITISTLGYGDITPVTDVAKAFSALEAIAGQLYLVVVVAWLVGTYRKPDKGLTG